MTAVSMTQGDFSATSTGLPSRLADIVGDAGSFWTEVWGRRPQSFHCQAAPRLLSRAEIWKTLDCGLLVAPYFGVFREDTSPALADITVIRSVQTRRMAAYADAEAIRERLTSGYTFRLNQPEHWHPGIKALVAGLREDLRAEVQSSVFLSPQEAKLAKAHNDKAHILMVQLAGHMHWVVGEDGQRADVTLYPGGVLYIPSSLPHYSTASGGDSLHMAIAILQPTARDLAELALSRFLNSARANDIAGSHHFMSLDDKVAWLRAELAKHLAGLDLGAVIDEAVRIRRLAGEV
jgi:hypothetical protein